MTKEHLDRCGQRSSRKAGDLRDILSADKSLIPYFTEQRTVYHLESDSDDMQPDLELHRFPGTVCTRQNVVV